MMEMPPLPPMPPELFGDLTGDAEALVEDYARTYGELCARMAREQERERCARSNDAMPWAVKTLRFLLLKQGGEPVGPHAEFEKAVAALRKG